MDPIHKIDNYVDMELYYQKLRFNYRDAVYLSQEQRMLSQRIQHNEDHRIQLSKINNSNVGQVIDKMV